MFAASTQEVDTFLEDSPRIRALLKENSLLKEQLQALEERTRAGGAREGAQETLMTTQRLVEEMKESGAARRASSSRGESQRRIIDASRKAEGDLHSEIQTSSACGASSGAWRHVGRCTSDCSRACA